MTHTIRLPTLFRLHAGGDASVTARGATVGEAFRTWESATPGWPANFWIRTGRCRCLSMSFSTTRTSVTWKASTPLFRNLRRSQFFPP